jgi:hypothetical protein
MYGTTRGFDYVHANQIAWYEAQVRARALERFGGFDPASGRVLPSMLLFHIPLPQVTEAVAALRAGRLEPGSLSGVAREATSPALVDSGLFGVAKRLGSTGEILVGHDHLDNASILWEGLRLTYGTTTGPTS